MSEQLPNIPVRITTENGKKLLLSQQHYCQWNAAFLRNKGSKVLAHGWWQRLGRSFQLISKTWYCVDGYSPEENRGAIM